MPGPMTLNSVLTVESGVLNTARMGWFSSDRAIREYAEEIWNVDVPPSEGQ